MVSGNVKDQFYDLIGLNRAEISEIVLWCGGFYQVQDGYFVLSPGPGKIFMKVMVKSNLNEGSY